MKKRTRLSFVGDLMFKEKSVPMYVQENGTYNFDCCFEKILPIFEKSDFIAGNLETTVSDLKENDYTVDVDFNAPVAFLDGLKHAGFTYLSTGNNHCLNRKKEGLIRTIENLDARGFLHGGTYKTNAVDRHYKIITIENCKIALFSYTFGTNTLKNKFFLADNDISMVDLVQPQQYSGRPFVLKMASHPFFAFRWIYRLIATCMGQPHFGEQSERQESLRRKKPYLERLKKQVEYAKAESPDYIIMMLHAGNRYHEMPSRWQEDLVDFLFSCGIDIILGAHSHRVQRCEYKRIQNRNTFVAYDLGNFCSTTGVVNGPYNKFSEYSVIMNFYIENAKIKAISAIICKSVLNENGKVVIVPAYESIQEEQDLQKKQKLEKDYKKVLSILVSKNIKTIEKEYFIYGEAV